MFQCFRMSEKSVLMKVSLGKKLILKRHRETLHLGGTFVAAAGPNFIIKKSYNLTPQTIRLSLCLLIGGEI